jgi:hypothetical protein
MSYRSRIEDSIRRHVAVHGEGDGRGPLVGIGHAAIEIEQLDIERRAELQLSADRAIAQAIAAHQAALELAYGFLWLAPTDAGTKAGRCMMLARQAIRTRLDFEGKKRGAFDAGLALAIELEANPLPKPAPASAARREVLEAEAKASERRSVADLDAPELDQLARDAWADAGRRAAGGAPISYCTQAGADYCRGGNLRCESCPESRKNPRTEAEAKPIIPILHGFSRSK